MWKVLSLRLVCGWTLLVPLLAGDVAAIIDRPWNEEVFYFAITDRFLDGDKENNIPQGSDPTLYDPNQSDMRLYHGGDFRGLELALQDGYFNDLGITTIWITPPVRNVWNSIVDSDGLSKTGYHGYWTQDFLDIDPHFTSRMSLDGKRKYPDSRDGRMQHYQDLVALAHRKGIKVIQDIVCNHAGPVFYYDGNGNGRLDPEVKFEWIPPFKHTGSYHNTRWLDVARWNQHRTSPRGQVTIFGQDVPTTGVLARMDSYGRKGMGKDSLSSSNGEEMKCDFMGLRSFDTAPDAAHFDALVREFVEIYAFYVETIGVDGFRIDTVKHVHHEFWDAFTEGLRKRLPPAQAKRLILIGEIYDGNPRKLGQYTYRFDWPDRRGPCLDSVLNFQFCYTLRSYLRTAGKSVGKAAKLETALQSLYATPSTGVRRPYYNQTPGRDGLNASQKIVNFFENHDGLNRFRVQGVSAAHNLLANALTLTLPGIPCLYYGTEVDLADQDSAIGVDAEGGRLTYFAAGDVGRFAVARKHRTYQWIAAFAKLRKKFPVLTAGKVQPLWVDSDANDADDGIFAFACIGEKMETVIVVMNASDQQHTAGVAESSMRLVAMDGTPLLVRGEQLRRIPVEVPEDTSPVASLITPVWNKAIPEVQIPIAPQQLDLYRIVR